MSGITIIDVKIVDLCSKCRHKDSMVTRDKNGRIYTDEEIECINCSLNIHGESKK